ncbi:MAG: cysteine peptidase family C39 domain-containing protein [Candidatus Thorarchaeota archaeon]
MEEKNVPYFKQGTLYRCHVASIRMILAKEGIEKSEEEIEEMLDFKVEEGADLGKLQKFFDSLGFETFYSYESKNSEEAFNKALQYLNNGFLIIPLLNRFVYDKKTPLIDKDVFWENENFSLHYVVKLKIDENQVYFHDPHEQIGSIKLDKETFAKAWSFNLPWKYVFLAVKK